jgi:hypothetical protein
MFVRTSARSTFVAPSRTAFADLAGSQAELAHVLQLHERYAQGQAGGAGARLNFFDLSRSSLRGRNLGGADRTGDGKIRP